MSHTSPEPRNGAPDGEAAARLIRMLRAASESGADLQLSAASAGEIADHMEELAREAGAMAARSRSLIAQLSYVQAQFDELLEMYDQLKALFVLGRDDDG